MGEQLYLERFVWFDNEARRQRFPNASRLGAHFEIAPKTAQRSIDHFRASSQISLYPYYFSRRVDQLSLFRYIDPDLCYEELSHGEFSG